MKKILVPFLSTASFAIFVLGLHFLADIKLFLAVGFGGLLLIHELGHVFALKKLGRTTNGVYFLPFIGAVTTTKEEFGTENEYAYFKYLGPLVGTLGVLVTLLLFFFLNDPDLLSLVFAGAILNLINLVPLTLLDGYGMLRGVVKHVKWIGFSILIVLGIFVFREYAITLFFLILFTLFQDQAVEKVTGFQLHEVILASAFILIIAFLTISQGESLIWNVTYLTLSIYVFGVYIKATCFDNKHEQVTRGASPLLQLTKKEKVLWAVRWLSLTVILIAVTALYFLVSPSKPLDRDAARHQWFAAEDKKILASDPNNLTNEQICADVSYLALSYCGSDGCSLSEPLSKWSDKAADVLGSRGKTIEDIDCSGAALERMDSLDRMMKNN